MNIKYSILKLPKYMKEDIGKVAKGLGVSADEVVLQALQRYIPKQKIKLESGSSGSLYDNAVMLARENKVMSTRLLQTKLRINYYKAALLLELMRDNIVIDENNKVLDDKTAYEIKYRDEIVSICLDFAVPKDEVLMLIDHIIRNEGNITIYNFKKTIPISDDKARGIIDVLVKKGIATRKTKQTG